MNKSTFDEICHSASMGHLLVSKGDGKFIPENISMDGVIVYPCMGTSWVEMPSVLFQIELSKSDFIKLSIIMLLISMEKNHPDVWINFNVDSDEINSIKIKGSIDCISVDNIDIRNFEGLSLEGLDELISNKYFWDLPYFGYSFKNSIKCRDLDAPEWVVGAFEIGSGRAHALFSIALNLLYFALNPSLHPTFVFDHSFGLLHGSAEALFSIRMQEDVHGSFVAPPQA
jgi:hypothetical protein